MKTLSMLALIGGLLLASRAPAQPLDLGVWSEWTAPAELIQDLPTLKARSLRLHLAIHLDPEQLLDVDGIELLLRDAENQKVEVWLWPLLTKARGYWLNQWNAETYAFQVRSLVASLQSRGLRFAGVSMDLEPPPEVLEELLQTASRLQFKKLVEIGRTLQNEALFENAKSEIRLLADYLHGSGLKTHLVTTSILLTDQPTDLINDALERSLGIPVVPEAFDYLSFMSYRSEFERMTGRMNARVVYEHGLRAKARYGEKAAIDLGVVGDIEFPHPVRGYRNPKRLHQDLGALRAAGIQRAQIYCWEGMRDPQWEIHEEFDHKPLFSFKFYLLDTLFFSLQNLLTKP